MGLALAATLLVYIGVVRFGFVFDDMVVIVENPVIRSWENFGWLFSHHLFASYSLAGNFYRPLNVAWFMVEYHLFGLAPAAWHLANLAWHLVATAAVYLFARRLTSDGLTSALAALFFGLHPIHMEAVAWVSGPNDIMITVFSIASFLAFARARERNQPLHWVLSLVSFAAALLIKEPAIVLPAFLAVWEWTRPEKSSDALLSRLRRTAFAVVPHAAVALAYLAVRRLVLGATFGAGTATANMLLTVPSIAVFYVKHAVWPVGLSVIYDNPVVTHPTFADFILPLLICAALAGLLFYAATRSRAALLAVAWSCISMLPPFAVLRTLGDLQLARDRYLYLASAGICVLAAIAIRRIPSRVGWLGLPRLQSAAALIVALLLAAATATQLLQYATPVLLFYRAVRIAPNNPDSHIGLGVALRTRGDIPRSIAEFEEAHRLRPEVWNTNFYLGGAYFFAGQPAKAIPLLEHAIEVSPQNSVAQYLYLGRALILTSQFDEAEIVLHDGRSLAEKIQVTAFYGPKQFDAELDELARRRAATPSSR